MAIFEKARQINLTTGNISDLTETVQLTNCRVWDDEMDGVRFPRACRKLEIGDLAVIDLNTGSVYVVREKAVHENGIAVPAFIR